MTDPTAPLTDPRQVTARWLAGVLRYGGHLPAGGVRDLAVERFRGKPLSLLLRLVPTWEDAPAGLPSSFILKIGKAEDTSPTARRRRLKEFTFYTEMAPAMPNPPAPLAWAAAWNPRTAAYHLLMTDLEPTHDRPPRGLPPTPEQADAAVLALADLHAAWWESPDLHEALALREPDWFARRLRAADDARALLAELGRYLSPGMRRALTAAADAWEDLLDDGERPVTIVHGDAHAWNCLTPLAGGPAVLLDWEAWSIEPSAIDLTAQIALRFDPDLRRALEPGLLAAYHARLLDGGVEDYPWEAFLADYRRAVLRRVMTPVSQWKRGAPVEQWWNSLSRIALACDEHGASG